MQEVELDEVEQQVLDALGAVEVRQGAARVDEVAAEAGLDRATTGEALASLLGPGKDLVRELSGGEPDLGPRYRIKDTAG